MARIVIVSQRLLGHFLPALGIAAELRARGHTVYAVAPAGHRAMIEEAGINFLENSWGSYPDRFVEELATELLRLAKGVHADVIISDSSQAAPAYAAEKLGIAWVSFQTTVPLADEEVPGKADVVRRLRDLYRSYLNQVRSRLQLPPLADPRRTRGDYAGVSPYLHLIMTLHEWPVSPAAIPPAGVVVGACSYERPGHSLHTRYEHRELLISSSSVPNPAYRTNIDRYIRAAIEAFADGSLRMTVTTPKRPELKGAPEVDNVEWIPQYPSHHHLLPHTDAALTHGGCGTLQKHMMHGVPMVIVPLGGDHGLLAAHCEAAGIAVVIQPPDVSPGRIREALERVLPSDSEYRVRAKRLAQSIGRQDANAVGADRIEELIHQRPYRPTADRKRGE